jgi:hypothetical protein
LHTNDVPKLHKVFVILEENGFAAHNCERGHDLGCRHELFFWFGRRNARHGGLGQNMSLAEGWDMAEKLEQIEWIVESLDDLAILIRELHGLEDIAGQLDRIRAEFERRAAGLFAIHHGGNSVLGC